MVKRRYIQAGFPLREASLDSVHEKNVRHGHVSTLHIWPARRPLAACRAALLPDPGTKEGRWELRRRIGGTVEEEAGRDGRMREVTVGGILHFVLGRKANAVRNPDPNVNADALHVDRNRVSGSGRRQVGH